MKRTIRVLLHPTPEQAETLAETSRQFTAVFNAVCERGWQARERNGVKLHHIMYRLLKVAYPALVSDLHVQARVKATEALRSALTLLRKGRTVRQPRSLVCPPRYDRHTYTLDWQTHTVSLSTTSGRQRIPFGVLPHADRYIGGKLATADLIQRKGRWWLHVVVTLPAPEAEPSDVVVGVDLGLAQPAVTSTNRFLGKRAWKAIEGRMFHLRRGLQKRGTKSAKRHLRRLRGRQARFRRHCDHVLAKQIVQAVPLGSTFVLENLTGIQKHSKVRKKTATSRRIHGWSFAQLKGFLVYKAEERGCTVAEVDPQHTSQTCSCCGHVARTNRRSRDRFVCQKCGYELHVDLNAARNIAAKYHASIAICDAGGLPVNQPIVSTAAPPALR